jgi:F0F1-type ATP synthase membrane subunit b/b'
MDADALLREAEEEIEAWLCDLDLQWNEILDDARAEAARIISDAQARAEDEYERLRALASEHAEAVRALAAAEDVDVADQHLESLHEAVVRLRAELSRVVDAAFDAMPAVEATADAIERVRGGRLRRLFRRR